MPDKSGRFVFDIQGKRFRGGPFRLTTIAPLRHALRETQPREREKAYIFSPNLLWDGYCSTDALLETARWRRAGLPSSELDGSGTLTPERFVSRRGSPFSHDFGSEVSFGSESVVRCAAQREVGRDVGAGFREGLQVVEL